MVIIISRFTSFRLKEQPSRYVLSSQTEWLAFSINFTTIVLYEAAPSLLAHACTLTSTNTRGGYVATCSDVHKISACRDEWTADMSSDHP
jgi:hypothetical protein